MHVMQKTNNFMVKATVQNLIDALSKIENKEQFVVLSTERGNFHYLQSIYKLTDESEDDINVIALTSDTDLPPSNYFKPEEIKI